MSNGYRSDGTKISKAKTIDIPKSVRKSGIEQYVFHKAEELEREFKYGYSEDAETAFEKYAKSWLARQIHYKLSTVAGYEYYLRITLAKYTEHWLEQVAPGKLALSTLSRDKQDVRKILPHLGHYKVTDINLEILRKFYDEMRQLKTKRTGEPIAEKTVEGIHSTICSILSDAVEEGYLHHNPAWRAYKPKGKPKEKIIADEELIGKIVECLERENIKYELYFKLVIATGMRRGECCGLRWSDISYKKKEIFIQRNVVKVSHHDIFVKEPKTNAGTRKVYISKDMVKLLKEYRKLSEFQCLQTDGRELTEEDYLFRKEDGSGRPMTPNTFTWRFTKILEKHNLPRELNIHSLRHSNASLLISQNVDVRTVANLLGHAQASTTLDIYSHAFDKTKKEASKKLEGVLGI